MKKALFGLLIGIMAIGLAIVGDGMAQTPAPGLDVRLIMNQTKYLLNDPNDPIVMELTLENVSGGPIIVPEGFSRRLFHLLFIFIDPDGGAITATERLDTSSEPVPPPVIPVGGELVPVEPVETLDPDFLLTISLPDARAFYSLLKAGNYSVRSKIALRTYPGVDFTEGGVDFSTLDSFSFAGSIQSNTLKFSLITDADGDGFFSDVDCDDNNPAINSLAVEIPGNGIDDDCNPATLDKAGSFGAFDIERARVKLAKGPAKDKFEVKGRFALGGASIDVLNEAVTWTFGAFQQTIPAGAFSRKGKRLRFKGAPGGITRIDIRDDGRFSFKAEGLDLSGLVVLPGSVPVSFQIGDDLGTAVIPFDKKGKFKSKKKKSKKKK